MNWSCYQCGAKDAQRIERYKLSLCLSCCRAWDRAHPLAGNALPVSIVVLGRMGPRRVNAFVTNITEREIEFQLEHESSWVYGSKSNEFRRVGPRRQRCFERSLM